MRFAPLVAASLLCAFSPAFAAETVTYEDSFNDSDPVYVQGVGGEVDWAEIEIIFRLSGTAVPNDGGGGDGGDDFADRHADRRAPTAAAQAGSVDIYLQGQIDTPFEDDENPAGIVMSGLFNGPVEVNGEDPVTVTAPNGSHTFTFTAEQRDWLETGFTLDPGFSYDFFVDGGPPSYAPDHVDANATYIIRYTRAESAVPEPATWAMMIAGFGLTGGAMRRRRRAVPSLAV